MKSLITKFVLLTLIFLTWGCKLFNIKPSKESTYNKELISKLDDLNAKYNNKYAYDVDQNGLPYAKGQIAINFKKGIDKVMIENFRKSATSIAIAAIPGASVSFIANGSSFLMKINNGSSPTTGCEDCNEKTQNTVARLQGDFSDAEINPNYFTMEADINADEARIPTLTTTPATVSRNGNGIIIGLIDSGVNYTESCFNGYLAQSTREGDYIGHSWIFNGYDRPIESNNPIDNSSLHGTKVAKIIIKNLETIQTLSGNTVAPKITILPLKIFDKNGVSSLNLVQNAIDYGITNGVKVFNCSFIFEGLNSNSINSTFQNEAFFVCAAGNSSVNLKDINLLPATLNLTNNNVLAVTALNNDNSLATGVNYSNQSVNMGAMAVWTICGSTSSTSAYTSYSTPVVSTGVAYSLAKNPTLSTGTVRKHIYDIIDNKNSKRGKLLGKIQDCRIFNINLFF